MKMQKWSTVLYHGVLAVLLGVWGNSQAYAGQHGQHGAVPMAAHRADHQHNQACRELMLGMYQKMLAMAMTVDPDYDFATMMRAHHQFAVDVARAQLKNGKDARMRVAAEEIIAEQTKQIAKFDRWIERREASAK